MTLSEVMAFLSEHGDERTKATLMKHGAREPFFGVKVADLKKVVKKIKKDHSLSLSLYETGNSDAMYLAGLIADETQMTAEILEEWVAAAYWYYLSEFTVPSVAADTAFGRELALRWMQRPEEGVAAAGWCTYSRLMAITEDEDLDLDEICGLLSKIGETIHDQQNRVRHTMNAFVIAAGASVAPALEDAQAVARQVGTVQVDMGGTACKVPLATAYITKVVDSGRVGRKRRGPRG
ncbi:MAG: DNA alkylation repair protein [Myxococcota bacterium]|nr:DNA alkylation repair protein [Myxococcota bacterium]